MGEDFAGNLFGKLETFLGMPALLSSSSSADVPGRRQLPAPTRLH